MTTKGSAIIPNKGLIQYEQELFVQESFVQCPVLYLSPLVVVLLVLVDSKCPLDWVEYDSKCIQFNKQQQSWTDAAVSQGCVQDRSG